MADEAGTTRRTRESFLRQGLGPGPAISDCEHLPTKHGHCGSANGNPRIREWIVVEATCLLRRLRPLDRYERTLGLSLD